MSISVGFESELILRVAQRRHLTPLVAALTSLRHAFGRRQGVTLALDGETLLAADVPFYNAGLYAMPCYAFGRRVFPSSSPCDGLAEASLALRSRDYWLGLAHGQGSPRRWRRARLESRLPVQVDGEAVALDRADLWVEPGALEVLVPPRGRPR